jgi:hypothetical protein
LIGLNQFKGCLKWRENTQEENIEKKNKFRTADYTYGNTSSGDNIRINGAKPPQTKGTRSSGSKLSRKGAYLWL